MKTSNTENMEEKILHSAEKLFIEQGFTKTSTSQIAKLAGCNQALVHYYYRTKDKLFNMIYQQKIAQVLNNLSSSLTLLKDKSIETKIKFFIGLHFDYLNKNSQLVPFLLNEIMTNSDKAKDLFEFFNNNVQNSIFAQMNKELNQEILDGKIANITFLELISNIISLNFSAIIFKEVSKRSSIYTEDELNIIMENRKQEIITTIMARIKK